MNIAIYNTGMKENLTFGKYTPPPSAADILRKVLRLSVWEQLGLPPSKQGENLIRKGG